MPQENISCNYNEPDLYAVVDLTKEKSSPTQLMAKIIFW